MSPKSTETVEIYALRDPLTQAVRYVGKAACSHKRLKSHMRDSRRRKTPVCLWIARLLKGGKAPLIEVLEVCKTTEWKERERYHIAQFRLTHDLLNLAEGGDEPFCPVAVRAENGRKVAKIRYKLSPERKRLAMMKMTMMTTLRWFERRGFPEYAERQRERMRGLAARVPAYCAEWAKL